jgi:hypothetical protein
VDDTGTQNLTENVSVTGAAGKINNCANFSDATGYFSHAYNAAAQPGISGNGATWATWFRRSDAAVAAGLGGSDGTVNPPWGLRTAATTGRLFGFVRDASVTPITMTVFDSTGPNMCDDAWHLVVMTYDIADKKTRLYRDGSLVVTSTNTGATNAIRDDSTGNLWGWDRAAGATNKWGLGSPTTAHMDQTATWDFALDSTEVTELWNSGNGLGWNT